MDSITNDSVTVRSIAPNLKIELAEFCQLWECGRFLSEKPCSYCPVIKDVQTMADEQDLQPCSWLTNISDRH